jgi:hypothetical protein
MFWREPRLFGLPWLDQASLHYGLDELTLRAEAEKARRWIFEANIMVKDSMDLYD